MNTNNKQKTLSTETLLARLNLISSIETRYDHYKDEDGNIDLSNTWLKREDIEATKWAVETLKAELTS